MRTRHRLLPVTQDEALEITVGNRLRSLRRSKGWSLDHLADRAGIGASTISRLETGRRRMALDQLVKLARALDTTADELLAGEKEEAVIIRPHRNTADGATFWSLTGHDDPSGRVVVKMRIPERLRLPEPRVHPGRDWFYVLEGTLRIRLGAREILVRTGQAASFDTMTPHAMGGHRGPVEILSILDHHGERAHLA
jgi:transcriptional regulator with XRE-family HTH domain